ncbi:MAG: AAA family ATPase [Bdellovibrionales bacterium]|nr:AAA family ATPase [Bdellovibrionales bacterium]MBT3526087.1 AAA family ATPase [Bdellovibrionales bacterium]MBT7670184.1 AAA family ATPase [Bdellovibrionales bacterium]MBT7765584.1 AAA family ATPase [Bdellovibrionales bacterium]
MHEKMVSTLNRAKGQVFGQDKMLDSIMAALVCGGHLLIEGMPGLGKTRSVSVMSKLCDLTFRRIQFTPDLLPSDLIGTMIFSQEREEFITKYGPIFTQILLADEINRSPAKVQSALLEAMGEKQVTIGDKTHQLTSPFVVLATQNPIDQDGTYPLPEAQMDRFMMKVKVEYPSFESEKNILELGGADVGELEALLSADDLQEIKNEVSNIYVDEKIKNLVVKIVQATRPSNQEFPSEFNGAILAGASPRAVIWLYQLGKFMAYMDGRDYVTPDHLLRVVADVIGHRIILSYEATIDNIHCRDVARRIAESVV